MVRRLSAVALLCGSALSGCASIDEKHHYAQYADDGVTPANFFRLSVKGNAGFTTSRFLAGNYDERAVDLFFNELKAPSNSKLFHDNQKDPGTQQTIKAIGPDAKDGTYVVILSSNVDSVVNAIGSFAESEVVAEAITNIVSSDEIRAKQKSDAVLDIQKAQGAAVQKQLASQLLDAGGATSPAEAQAAYLRVLNTLARALGHDQSFPDFVTAREWFRLEQGVAK